MGIYDEIYDVDNDVEWMGGRDSCLKVGELREDTIEVGVALVYEKKKAGGWRSPVELWVRIEVVGWVFLEIVRARGV